MAALRQGVVGPAVRSLAPHRPLPWCGGSRHLSGDEGSRSGGKRPAFDLATSDGPPPPSRITVDAVPSRLRAVSKTLKCQAVVFDFDVLLYADPSAGGAPDQRAQMMSGWDPRHTRNQGAAAGTGPVHGGRAFVAGIHGPALTAALTARKLDPGEGTVDEQRARLGRAVRQANLAWLKELMQKEMRKQLEFMGLDATGKSRELHDKLERALWEGSGTAPDFQSRVPTALRGRAGAVAADSFRETDIQQLTAALNVDVEVQSTAQGIALSSSSSSSRGRPAADEEDEAMDFAALKNRKKTKKGLPGLKHKELSDDEVMFDVTAKYRKALMAKTGGVLQSNKTDTVKGDADALSSARAALDQAPQASDGGGAGPSGRWLLNPAVGELLSYLDVRSMKICVVGKQDGSAADLATFQKQLPRAVRLHTVLSPAQVATHFESASKDAPTGSDSGGGAAPAGRARSTGGGGFMSLFGLAPFSPRDKPAAAATNTPAWASCMSSLVKDLAVDPGKVVVVSTDAGLLRAARQARCLTVGFQPPQQPRVDASVDHTVGAVSELKHVVDDINGISFR